MATGTKAPNLSPYAPPEARLDVELASEQAGPALYNPTAAANWSLMLTPVFGSYLHWKNWQAMGEPRGRGWFIACCALLPFYASVPGMAWAVIIGWYFASAKAQVKFVEAKWEGNYPRRPMGAVVLKALAIMLASAFAVGLLSMWVAGDF